MECTWNIKNVNGHFLVFTFLDVKLDGNDRIQFSLGSVGHISDIVMTINNKLGVPNSLTINKTEALITFQSDMEGRDTGFLIESQSRNRYGKYLF